MAIKAEIIHGTRNPILLSQRETDRREGKLGILVTVSALRDNLYTADEPVPFNNDYTISEVERERDGDEYIYSITGFKFNTGNIQLEGYPQKTGDLMGMDTAVDAWETASDKFFTLGKRMAGATAMVCVGYRSVPLNAKRTRWRHEGNFVGVLTGNKPVKEQTSYNLREFQRDSVRILGLTGGWTDYRKANLAFSEPVRTISYISVSLPNFYEVGLPQTPPKAPPVWTPPLSGDVSEFTFNWPNGWVLSALACDPIPGTTIGPVQAIYTYRPLGTL